MRFLSHTISNCFSQILQVWNRELLFVGGLIARSAYEQEINNIGQIWANTHGGQLDPIERETETWLLHRGLHALKFFTFYKSSPSEEVSATFENAFFSCASQSFPIVSTRGVQNAYTVRHPDAALTAFMKRIPLVPDCVLEGSQRMVTALRSREMLKEISFEDVIGELQERPLDEQEMLACLQWWIKSYKAHSGIEKNLHRKLIDAAVLAYGENKETLIQLSKIRTFINPSQQIPLDGPLPDHLFPVSLSKKLATVDMSNCLHWTELTILEWIKWICSPSIPSPDPSFNLDTSPQWTERVLFVLARTWPNLPPTAREEIKSLLEERTCIPTSQGMKKPTNAYFASADIFHDLPVVILSSGVIKAPFERLLEALGVQKHVNLQLVFNRCVWRLSDGEQVR